MEETGAETDKTLSKQSWDSKKVRATGWANSFFFSHPAWKQTTTRSHVEVGALLSFTGAQALASTVGLSDCPEIVQSVNTYGRSGY